MQSPFAGRRPAAEHDAFCDSGLCCRCQQRPWSTHQGGERLCGPCAACCRECGRAPAPHLEGLAGGVCAECRGLCARCRRPLLARGGCPCRRWRARAGTDPVGYVLQAFPQPLLQALGHRVPQALPELVRRELERRTPDQLLDRLERRWGVRWSHALYETDEDGRRRHSPEDIATALLAPSACREPRCEDGQLTGSGAACPECRAPEHRFAPGAGPTADPAHVRAKAAEMRRALAGSPHRTGQGHDTRRSDPAERTRRRRLTGEDEPGGH
ncbi:hypothetical protein [Streptomyces sp. NPDC058045]|uniref:hypothetical protein n=1 Tax=Streptomyces sp. NPDC058045 TaxID=3346311 RepID=UPI0036E92776